MAKIIVEIPDSLKKAFEHKLIDEGQTQKNVIEKFVEDYVKENEKNGTNN